MVQLLLWSMYTGLAARLGRAPGCFISPTPFKKRRVHTFMRLAPTGPIYLIGVPLCHCQVLPAFVWLPGMAVGRVGSCAVGTVSRCIVLLGSVKLASGTCSVLVANDTAALLVLLWQQCPLPLCHCLDCVVVCVVACVCAGMPARALRGADVAPLPPALALVALLLRVAAHMCAYICIQALVRLPPYLCMYGVLMPCIGCMSHLLSVV
jgi:hypothetical protein